eukprot:CAMPEP_0119107650 /NCGR_PEP_ID=MMETSP1180-20130426/11522_1 /TAXON_ID=3052 ORGANISM="Chlamydomonas cf sp, Strain CCMP681" /NCGR_SAMPLE_ID=MMETSP1180 /ASSEMBLY_ACC=CAM_ASM_000741 /LENGTH=220 /DNA_ID=CAMNT_0007093167 /DNA_START=11 /DNA_END=673 /DNA_ORIENTATION=+
MTNAKLLYALVARGTVVLAESTIGANGNVALVALRILEKIGDVGDMRVSYAQDRHMFHVLAADGVIYLVMAEEATGRQVPFAFLEDLRNRFSATYGQASEAVAYEYNTEFAPIITQRMTFFMTDPSADSITRVKGQLVEVKDIMIENIEKVLERGEKLDLLVDKTDNLQETAFTFRREARRLQRTLWWRNKKLMIGVIGSVLLLIYVLLALSCGVTLRNC